MLREFRWCNALSTALSLSSALRSFGARSNRQGERDDEIMSMMLARGRHSATTAALVGGRLLQPSTAQLSKTQVRSFYSLYEKYAEAYKRYGWKLSLWKLYNPGDIKFGREVGQDEFGNKYYEDPDDLHLQHRWTEFKVDSFDEFEGTLIPPQWHLWLQHTTDALPTDPGQNVRAYMSVSMCVCALRDGSLNRPCCVRVCASCSRTRGQRSRSRRRRTRRSRTTSRRTCRTTQTRRSTARAATALGASRRSQTSRTSTTSSATTCCATASASRTSRTTLTTTTRLLQSRTARSRCAQRRRTNAFESD